MPTEYLTERAAEARAILTDPASRDSLRALAMRFLKRWGM